MEIHILPLAYLKAEAETMIKPLSIEEIRKHYSIDSEGFIRLALNCLLIIEGDRVVLIDPGCADFLPARIMKEYGLEITETMESILEKKGLSSDQVTDVIFTHLHFDHGSAAFRRKPGKIEKSFPNARYHVLKEHFDYALKPDSAESNSFFTVFFKYIDKVHWLEDWILDWLRFKVYQGHTRGMVVPVINSGSELIYYVSDLIPMQIFLDEEIWCGYDLHPDLLRSEKLEFLSEIREPSKIIFFHDTLTDSISYP
jgi:glyoxylase-like metal-dependent hydrolase (beta-lactamase superfamily II)